MLEFVHRQLPIRFRHGPFAMDVIGCVKMQNNRFFENVGCTLGSRLCENATCARGQELAGVTRLASGGP